MVDLGVVGELESPVPHLGEVAPRRGVPEGHDHAHRVVESVVVADQPPGCPQVGDLVAHRPVGVRLVVGVDGPSEPLCEMERPVEEPFGSDVEFVGGEEAVVGIGADGVEHPVARGAAESGVDHGGVDEVGECAGGVRGQGEASGDGLGGGQVEAIGEDAEVPEQSLLVVGEQVVGPCDGVPKRRGAAVTEKVERSVEASAQVVEAERGQPSGGQLDGEGDAVEAAHDVANDAQRVRGGREVGTDATGAVDEHGHCRAAGEVVESGGARDRQ